MQNKRSKGGVGGSFVLPLIFLGFIVALSVEFEVVFEWVLPVVRSLTKLIMGAEREDKGGLENERSGSRSIVYLPGDPLFFEDMITDGLLDITGFTETCVTVSRGLGSSSSPSETSFSRSTDSSSSIVFS